MENTCTLWRGEADGRIAPFDASSGGGSGSGAVNSGLQDKVLDVIAEKVKAKRSSIKVDMPVQMLGIDSIRIMTVAKGLSEKLGWAVPARLIAGKTVSEIVQALTPLVTENGSTPQPPAAPAAAAAPVVKVATPSPATTSSAVPRAMETKVVHPSSRIEEDVSIGHFTVVEES